MSTKTPQSPEREVTPVQAKFSRNERVRLSSAGRHHFRYSKSARFDRGVVHGFSRSPLQVLILRDGTKWPVGFHMDFWEQDDA